MEPTDRITAMTLHPYADDEDEDLPPVTEDDNGDVAEDDVIWLVVRPRAHKDQVHVQPDRPEHEPSPSCWCELELLATYDNGNLLWLHRELQ